MLASEAQLIAGSILADVLRVSLGQALDGGVDGLHATLLPHAGSGEVGVSPSTWARTHVTVRLAVSMASPGQPGITGPAVLPKSTASRFVYVL